MLRITTHSERHQTHKKYIIGINCLIPLHPLTAAESLSLSEASIKRVFSSGSFSLDRFLEICEVSGVSPESLFAY